MHTALDSCLSHSAQMFCMMSPRGYVYLLCVSLLACLSNANLNACDAPQEAGLNDACGQSIERSSPEGVRSLTQLQLMLHVSVHIAVA